MHEIIDIFMYMIVKIVVPLKVYPFTLSRVATVREKYLENEFFFQVRE